ncbi:hypothetical protein POJ06DRAFT_113254 [Lipomyces tetrasporus]|uniref:Uncharacterized protein n=1 Tax=Lipomyces tetrasporus TaxID=54092 RepID=A0AAD7VR48_9ASCO|nr:uncharacterized protein POJ06DRAFT_113254 [Lipomyces tetrasporus]KAJ8099607.1 hypothetical protein POJ06DRAFT_113254 [Lipomyces tetrasporus]
MNASRSQSAIEMVAAESATMAFLKAASPGSDLSDERTSLSRSESPLDIAEESSLATSLSSTSISSSSLPKMARFAVVPTQSPKKKKKTNPGARRSVETTCPLTGCSPLPIKGPRSALRHFESHHHQEMFSKLLDHPEMDAGVVADNLTASKHNGESVIKNGTCTVEGPTSAKTINLPDLPLPYFYNNEHYKYILWIAATGYHHEFAKTHRNGVRDLIAFDALMTISVGHS